jgi:two-component sensor histidine kinase
MVLPIEKAIPLGLIANELIVNSLKHGLKQRTGNLSVTLAYADGDRKEAWARLRVEDDGPGFPESFDVAQSASMGYRLVNLLVRQLRARLDLESGPAITVTFPVTANPGPKG